MYAIGTLTITHHQWNVFSNIKIIMCKLNLVHIMLIKNMTLDFKYKYNAPYFMVLN